jgi:hypothetical protein
LRFKGDKNKKTCQNMKLQQIYHPNIQNYVVYCESFFFLQKSM